MMSESEQPDDLQEAVERSYRIQWGGKRFCLVTAIVLFVLAVLAAVVLSVSRFWFQRTDPILKVVEISALATSFICLMAAVMFAMEALIRSQREHGHVPDRVIHAALCLSVVTVAALAFLLFLFFWGGHASGMGSKLAGIVRFIVFLFAGLVWLGSVVMNAAGVTMLVTRRTDLLEVNNTTEGTALLFRRGRSGEIVKLSTAAIIPLIIFVVALLMAGSAHIL
jgi:hypothetical protein